MPVWAVLDYTETRTITRELLLAKVSILGPEYLEDQLVGGPSHEPRRNSLGLSYDRRGLSPGEHHIPNKQDRENALAQSFQQSANPSTTNPTSGDADHAAPTLTPSEALRIKHQHFSHIKNLAEQFSAQIVDVSDNSLIVQLTAKTSRVDAFLSLLRPFGLIESTRTGEFVVLCRFGCGN